ncbi:MAG: hypothetical protein ACR2RV_03410, partial [Verrucomicrobiales bacterium]
LALVAMLLSVCGAPAMACKVPVFRYALDHWPGSEYTLRTSLEAAVGHSNLKLLEVEEDKSQLFAPFDKKVPVWSGEIDEKTCSALIDSPQRQEIVRRIIGGDSAVWVLVESGDKAADDELFERLDDRLTFFQSVAKLPEIDPGDPASQLGPGPELELKFSILRLRRDDPEEALLVKLLAGPKLADLPEGKPFVAPVFGQGRVLGAWTGESMDAEGIEEASFFLTGACSCQVKAQNPGWDLLLSVDWKERLLSAEGERVRAGKKVEQ